MYQQTKTEPTFTVSLYMAGDIETAKQELRRECYREGLCVTVTPTTFIYTAGEEAGFCVGFVNYPRFPKQRDEIWKRAFLVAEKLLDVCFQWSALLVGPDKTEWITRRTEDKK